MICILFSSGDVFHGKIILMSKERKNVAKIKFLYYIRKFIRIKHELRWWGNLSICHTVCYRWGIPRQGALGIDEEPTVALICSCDVVHILLKEQYKIQIWVHVVPFSDSNSRFVSSRIEYPLVLHHFRWINNEGHCHRTCDLMDILEIGKSVTREPLTTKHCTSRINWKKRDTETVIFSFYSQNSLTTNSRYYKYYQVNT